MRRRKKARKPVFRKRLTYGIIAISFILIILLIYSSQQSSNQNSRDQTSISEAAIVDHLSIQNPNPNFTKTCKEILENDGFTVHHYEGWAITVDFYKYLFKHGYRFIVLRVHSAITILNNTEFVGLFTWESYSIEVAYDYYYDDVMNDRLVEAYFTEAELRNGTSWFGIAPGFVEEYGYFPSTVIVMMGCDGLTYTSMAEAFVNKGAKVYIGWNGPVAVVHTDQATTHLLQRLITENKTIEESVEDVSEDPYWGGTLGYYPHTVGNDVVLNVKNRLRMDVAEAKRIFIRPLNFQVMPPR